jgi:vacuolar-type H+-ATPase subunit H
LEGLVKYVIVVAAIVNMVLVLPAFADCQSDIDELKAQVDDEKGSYTREARKEARKHLAKAEHDKDDAKACKTEILNARKALQKGKR